MRQLFLALTLAAASVSVSAQAAASNDLGQCVADSTTGKDRKDLVRWMVASMVQHPAMADLSTVSQSQFEDISKTAARLLERLMTVDCKTAFKTAFQNGGEQAIRTGFEHVGRLAMQEIAVDPKVSAAMGSLSKYADTRKMIQAVSE